MAIGMIMKTDLYQLVHYYFEQGGAVNVLIFVAAIVIFYCSIDKIVQLYTFSKQLPSANILREALINGTIPKNIPESFKQAFSDLSNRPQGSLSNLFYINRYREILIAETERLEQGLSTMAVWINSAPLLGLFGTVIGMTQTFGVITLYGIGNPTLLSAGISLSLITTQTGLLVAFPGLILHNYLSNKKNKAIHSLINIGELVFHSEGESNAF